MYWNDVEKVKDGVLLLATGKKFFERLATSSHPDHCALTFEWNENLSKAVIKGYFEELLGWLFGSVVGRVITLTVELEPFWAWKFGVESVGTLSEAQLQELDDVCCRPSTASCEGPAVLGKGDECDTISVACTAILSPDQMATCAMWKRWNLLGGFLPIPGNAFYFGYPLGDKSLNPTGFFDSYVQAFIDVGVTRVFHGS